MSSKKKFCYQLTEEEKVLKKNSLFRENNTKYADADEVVKYHLIEKKICEYACSSAKCPTKKGNWRRKQMYLILYKKNGIDSDLRIDNLQLICPNCYCQEKGPIDLTMKIKKIERKCRFCSYILTNNSYNDICYVCSQKKRNLEFETDDNMAELAAINFDKKEVANEYKKIMKANHDQDNVVQTSYSSTRITKSKPKGNIELTNNIDIELNIDIKEDILAAISEL